jgi:hypothetical protein
LVIWPFIVGRLDSETFLQQNQPWCKIPGSLLWYWTQDVILWLSFISSLWSCKSLIHSINFSVFCGKIQLISSKELISSITNSFLWTMWPFVDFYICYKYHFYSNRKDSFIISFPELPPISSLLSSKFLPTSKCRQLTVPYSLIEKNTYPNIYTTQSEADRKNFHFSLSIKTTLITVASFSGCYLYFKSVKYEKPCIN